MDIRKLQRVIVDALDDVKARDIRVFNTSGQTGMFDRVIVATGTSNRQTRALASHVRDKAKAAGGHVISTEGEEAGEWVLVDLGDAVVHIMQPAIRVYYNLEELWGAKPVRIKLNGNGAAGHAPAEPAPKRARPGTRAKAPDEAARQALGDESGKAPHTSASSTPATTAAKKPGRPRAKASDELPAGAGESPAGARESPAGAREPQGGAGESPAEGQMAVSTPKRRVARKVQVG